MKAVRQGYKRYKTKQKKHNVVRAKKYTQPEHTRKVDDVDADLQKYAVVADIAYARSISQKESRLYDNMPHHEQYTIDTELTSKLMTVVVNKSNQEVIVSFKGTDELSDLPADFLIAIGMESYSKRFKTSAKLFASVLGKYKGSWKIALASHSLGGSINTYVAHKFKDNKQIVRVENFNPGSSPLAAVATASHPPIVPLLNTEHKHITNHHVVGDPISLSAAVQKSNTRIHKPKFGSSNPHSIHQFI